MGKFDKSKVNKTHEDALRRKFGDLYDWEKPLITDTVGPFDPTAFDGFATRLEITLSTALATLHELNITDISSLYDQEIDDPHANRVVWTVLLTDEINRLHKRKPHWLSGGFGNPAFVADFEYWGQMEEFDLHEALLLSVGIEPKYFTSEKLKASKEAMEKRELLEPIEFLVMRHEQFYRKFPSGPNGKRRVGPAFLYDWFTEVSMAVHPRFLQVLQSRALGQSIAVGEPSHVDASPAKTDKREVDKIAQLFAAMAIDQLGYDPKAKRSPVPKEITDLAASMGLEVSDDTVRKYLKAGAKFIPDGWEPE